MQDLALHVPRAVAGQLGVHLHCPAVTSQRTVRESISGPRRNASTINQNDMSHCAANRGPLRPDAGRSPRLHVQLSLAKSHRATRGFLQGDRFRNR